MILFILFVLGSVFGAGGGLALAPSVVVGPLGADFVHFVCFLFVFGAGGGLALAPSVVLGPFGC